MSDAAPHNQDVEHLKLLSIFHYVCAGLVALFACFPIFHLIIGLVVLFNPGAMGSGNNAPPQFLGWFFVVFASCFILAGWTFAALLAWAGRNLGRRQRYTFCFVMACVSCVFMP